MSDAPRRRWYLVVAWEEIGIVTREGLRSFQETEKTLLTVIGLPFFLCCAVVIDLVLSPLEVGNAIKIRCRHE